MTKEKKNKDTVEALYSLDGKINLLKAFPFGLQHILAMFVANITPIIIVAAACGLGAKDTAMIIQSAMIIAGIGTFIQLFPIWRIGSRLPIVMGISFTFVSLACTLGAQYGYGTLMGAVLIGGIVEGLLGLFCKILDKSYFADCSSNGCYGNRIFTSFCWCGFLRRRNGSSRFWFCQQLDTWNCNPCKLHFIQYTCKRLFKTAFCFIRTCCGIYCGTLYGNGGFFSTS